MSGTRLFCLYTSFLKLTISISFPNKLIVAVWRWDDFSFEFFIFFIMFFSLGDICDSSIFKYSCPDILSIVISISSFSFPRILSRTHPPATLNILFFGLWESKKEKIFCSNSNNLIVKHNWFGINKGYSYIFNENDKI